MDGCRCCGRHMTSPTQCDACGYFFAKWHTTRTKTQTRCDECHKHNRPKFKTRAEAEGANDKRGTT